MSVEDIVSLNIEVNSLRKMIKELEKRLKTQEGHMEFVLTSSKGIYKDE